MRAEEWGRRDPGSGEERYLRGEQSEAERVQRGQVAGGCACAAHAAHLDTKPHKHATHRADRGSAHPEVPRRSAPSDPSTGDALRTAPAVGANNQRPSRPTRDVRVRQSVGVASSESVKGE